MGKAISTNLGLIIVLLNENIILQYYMEKQLREVDQMVSYVKLVLHVGPLLIFFFKNLGFEHLPTIVYRPHHRLSIKTIHRCIEIHKNTWGI